MLNNKINLKIEILFKKIYLNLKILVFLIKLFLFYYNI